MSELNIIVNPESENIPTNLPRNSSLPPEEPVMPLSLKEPIPPNLPRNSSLPPEEPVMPLSFKEPIPPNLPSLLTYKTMDTILTGNYSKNECNDSMICDIIAMYLKGQKILYIEAKTLCEQRLSYLMLPTICITAICSVISIALKEYQYGALIVSSLNALNFFFLNLKVYNQNKDILFVCDIRAADWSISEEDEVEAQGLFFCFLIFSRAPQCSSPQSDIGR
jgi:hypothetical protein